MSAKANNHLKPSSPAFTPGSNGVLQRKCACGNHTIAGGECAECAKKKSGLQRKLTIGANNDPLEQEADRVADQVMAAQLNSAVNAIPPRIQRFTGQANDASNTAPASVDHVLADSGRPLEPGLQKDMGQRFGHDFSQVRVHTGDAADQSAQEVNANAYTVGHNIVFGEGRFAPGSHEGRRLIAHELTHVVQQSGSCGFHFDQGVDKSGRSTILPHVDRSPRTAALQRQNKDKKNQPQVPKVVLPVEPSKAQKKMVDEARHAAAIRTQIAMFKARGIQGASKLQEAQRLAQIKFDWANPNMEQISEVLSGMGGGLITVDVKVAGAGDPECGNRAGYVRDHQAPIVLCPGFFTDPGNKEGRIRTMIHEMAHVKGIGKSVGGEEYFVVFDCTSKGAFESADSWANYVHCLSGQTPDKPEEITTGKGKG